MNILVIGGTYFLGKAFVELASAKHRIILMNRGSRTVGFAHEENITQFLADRHDAQRLKELMGLDFDIVVDFCAYEKGDIQSILKELGAKIRQYIFISTCDVYRRGMGKITDESGELEDRDFGGEAGAYILGKAALERELSEGAKQYGIQYTSIRPVFIYGPDNYAPREGIFFNWIVQAGQIIYPMDSDGHFQMVYVKDVARAILETCGNAAAYDRAYNVCGEGLLDYEAFADILREATEIEFEKVSLTVEDIEARGIPLPFPLKEAESEQYFGGSIKELGIVYTPIAEGMKETFRAFMSP